MINVLIKTETVPQSADGAKAATPCDTEDSNSAFFFHLGILDVLSVWIRQHIKDKFGQFSSVCLPWCQRSLVLSSCLWSNTRTHLCTRPTLSLICHHLLPFTNLKCACVSPIYLTWVILPQRRNRCIISVMLSSIPSALSIQFRSTSGWSSIRLWRVGKRPYSKWPRWGSHTPTELTEANKTQRGRKIHGNGKHGFTASPS